jgi:hypothetical protein
MELFFPSFLSRQKAMLMTRLTRRKLELLIKQNKVKFITTKGGHKRYLRDDIIKLIYEQI